MVSMGVRAVSISPQTTVDVAAAAYNWMPKTYECSGIEPILGYDIPNLLVFSHAIQREADPTTMYGRITGKGFLDEYAGLPLCGLAGQPTSLVWLVGAIDPDLLTVTFVDGLTTADQLINALCTRWMVQVDPTTGRDTVEWEVIGTPVDPITTPSVTIPTSTIQRAGQTVITRNAAATKMLAYSFEATQPTDPLYTTPLTTSSTQPFVLPDEQESEGVLAKLTALWKLLVYSGSSLEKARTAVPEAWIMTATRGSLTCVISTPAVQNTKAQRATDKPRQRQPVEGPVLYNSGIAALASVTFGGSGLTYAKS